MCLTALVLRKMLLGMTIHISVGYFWKYFQFNQPYPDSTDPTPGNVHSIEIVWLFPRVIMGILAVVDTFLIYKIAEWRYNRNVAFIAIFYLQ